MGTRGILLMVGLLATCPVSGHLCAQTAAGDTGSLADRAKAVLAQHTGTIMLTGIAEPVEVLRDRWGTPHIYPRSTAAPGWNAIGGTEPGLPGISIGHNDRIARGFTIPGMDQQDLSVGETSPIDRMRTLPTAAGHREEHDAAHGVQWADVAGDGVLDLSLADNGPTGTPFLFRHRLPAASARRSVCVLVLDERGRYTSAGSEVRVYAAGTTRLRGTRLVDTGSGYRAQKAGPVHIGVPDDRAAAAVDVVVTYLTGGGRQTVRLNGRRPAGTPVTVQPGMATSAAQR